MKQRNALGGAYEAAHEATNLAADISLVLDIASERPQPGFDSRQRQEIEEMFAKLRTLVDEANAATCKALDAQPVVQPAQSAVQRPGHARRVRRARR